MSLEALKRRFEGEADAAALPPTAPAPPAPADKAAAGGAAAAEEPAGSFAVNVEHDSETGGDDTPTRCATLHLSLPAAALVCGCACSLHGCWQAISRWLCARGVAARWPPSSAASRHSSPTQLQ